MKGLVEHILVKVVNFYFLVDFFILETDAEMLNSVPIILGSSFLSMPNANIRFRIRAMTIRVGKISLDFDIYKVM